MSRSVSSSARGRRSVVPRKAKDGILVPEDARAYRALAASWLRYVRGCTLVTFERSPWDTKALPDALGLDQTRRLIEVEIKVSKADFLHDAEKPHRRSLLTQIMGRMTRAPQELWYLVPRRLAPVVFEHGPEYAGILVPSDTEYDQRSGLPILEVHRSALRLHSFKLPIQQVFVMAKDMAGTLASVLRDHTRLMGELMGAPFVIAPTEQSCLDRDHFLKSVPDRSASVNASSVLPTSQPMQQGIPNNDGVRKSWSNLGRSRSGCGRSAPGETRSSG